ncbi:MAG: hypothetical protein DMF60_19950 [Acidobacteria bacterium]|nr:MAG: hypothetical protein DMF60_19950 [Acidobacteriota bacterium]
MSEPLIIEEGPMPPDLALAFEKSRRNRQWFNEHVTELKVYERYRGRYVAAAKGELFVADTPEEIRRLVSEKYPEEVPHVRYIPRKKLSRIYACQR